MRTIARASGGVYDPSPESIFSPPERSARRAVPLWPFLVMATAVLLMVDVALRRIDFALLLGKFSVALRPRRQ